MPLSNEDNLRLNVLMAQKLKAVRIDEGKMLLYALTTRGEAKIRLNPNVKNDRYLKQVRDFLSTKILGMPDGFPIFIAHWNRLGQANADSLDKLLLIGEESATIAVVNSKQLTAELAASAWWVYQSADNARSMLANKCVVDSVIGKELANFLLEFLPFEELASDMLCSVRLVLQTGLISEEDKLKLWKKAKSKNTLYLGFLDILPNDIPEPLAAHNDYTKLKEKLSSLIEANNHYAISLCHLFSPAGQTFINTAKLAFKRPSNQIIYDALIEAIQFYISNLISKTQLTKPYNTDKLESRFSQQVLATNDVPLNLEKIQQFCEALLEQQAIQDILSVMPQLREIILSMLILSRTSTTITLAIFSQSTAQGSLMRKKLKPVTDVMTKRLGLLQG